MSDFAEDINVPTNDCISRQAAINTVVNMRNRCDNDINDFYDLLIESFKVLPSAEGWIPVSERLPKKGGWYLVTWEDQFKTVRGVTVSEFVDPKGLTDIGHFEGFVLREITAWMELPKPYKEEVEIG